MAVFVAAISATSASARGPAKDVGPHDAPPSPKVEKIQRRTGSVWIGGYWEWKNTKWEWESGHFERARIGKRFTGTHWELRGGEHGNLWVRVDGEWQDAGGPPALKDEPANAKAGYVFVRGHWNWDNGEWVWQPGRLERERLGYHWREDRWEQRGADWVLVGGGWEAGGTATVVNTKVIVKSFPTSAPPAPKTETIGSRAGFVWDPGHWEWRNEQWAWLEGHYERELDGHTWSAGRWEKRSGRYEWIAGEWKKTDYSRGRLSADDARGPQVTTVRGPGIAVGVSYPTVEPPAPPADDKIPELTGDRFWVPGHYIWRDARYTWTAGHVERARRGERFLPGAWEHRRDRYVWIEGRWEAERTVVQTPVKKS